jgi:hypothetical protein
MIFKKMVQRSKQNNIPIMQSTLGFSQIKSFISNINTEDREITCFDDHAIPDDDSWEINEDLNEDEGNHMVNNRDQNLNTTNNTPYLESIEPMDKNTSTESTGPHLIKIFEQSKNGHLPEGIQDHLPEGIQDPKPNATISMPKNPSATNSMPKNPSANNSVTKQPENGMTKSGICLATCRVPQCGACYNDKASRQPWQEKRSAGKFAVDPLTVMWQCEDGLPHNNSQQEESQLNNLTPELLQWHYKLSHESSNQWMVKPGILPKPLTTCQAW